MRCHRCDWNGDDLPAHATDTGHPLCVICRRSLTLVEQQTCERCLTATREALHELLDLYDRLPAAMHHLRSPSDMALAASHSDEQPLPGGDALVLLSDGSQGLSEAADTWRATDPPSAAFHLTSWEDDFRHRRGEPAATPADAPKSRPGDRVRAEFRAAAVYLDRNTRWAASHHPAFDEFHGDVLELLGRVRRTTSTDEHPERGQAPCFECGHVLVRGWTDTGLADRWECRGCGRVYEDPEYWLAVRAELLRHQEAG